MLAVAVQLDPNCVTVIDFPAIVNVVVRCEKTFPAGPIDRVAEPTPLGLETVSQGAPGTAVQAHEEGNMRLMKWTSLVEEIVTD